MTRIAIYAAVLVFASTAGSYGNPVEAVRPAIAIVEVRGTDSHSAPLEGRGTGFFIDGDGYILTSYHLVSEILEQGADKDQLQYDVVLDPTTASNPIRATFAWLDTTADLLILSTPLADRHLTILKPADRDQVDIQLAQTPIYTVGYPKGNRYESDQGIIKSFAPPFGSSFPEWTTSLNFKDGQSGSPILLDDGRVVAVVKESDVDAASFGYVVPIRSVPPNYWAGALPAPPNGSANGLSRVVISTVTPPAPRARQLVFTVSNNPCDGARHQYRKIAATKGWRILGAIADPTVWLASGASATARISDQDDSGFTIDVYLENAGSCSQFMGWTLQSDTPASYRGVVNYFEEPLQPTSTVAEAAAISRSQLSIPISDSALTFNLLTSDGRKIPFSARKNEIVQQNGQQLLEVDKIAARIQKASH